MKFRFFTACCLILFLATALFAQVDPEKILETGDVERFIKTFPQITQELEELGMEYDGGDQSLSIPEGMMVNQQVLSVLKKHGWDENFWQKAMTIIAGYASVAQGRAMTEAESTFNQQLKELDSNPNLSAEMKAQMKQQLEKIKAAMGMTHQGLGQMVHPEDMLLITPHIENLKEILDK